MCRPMVFNPDKIRFYDVLRANIIAATTLMSKEENQIRGSIYVLDLSGVGFRHLQVVTPYEAVWLGTTIEVFIR